MKKKQNAGFTLLELLIAMMMSMIIILGVGQFLVSATNHYKAIDNQVTLQMDAQDAVNTISDFIMEGNNISRVQGTSETMYSVYYDLGKLDVNNHRISRENANQRIFWLNQADGNLYMFHPDSKSAYDNIVSDPGHSNPMLLAEGVESFSISVPKAGGALTVTGLDAAEYETKNCVPIRIEIKINSTKMTRKKSVTDVSFKATQEVAIRNRIQSID